MATCPYCPRRIHRRNSIGLYHCRSHGVFRRAESDWLRRMQEFGWPETYYHPTSIFARWNMPDYICEFTDGSYSEITDIHWWGKGHAAGIARRGDGKSRVVFWQDHPPTFGPLLMGIPHDPWVHNIRRRRWLHGGDQPQTRFSYADQSASV